MAQPIARGDSMPQDRRPIVVLLVDDQPFVGAAVSRLLAAQDDIALHCCHQPDAAMKEAERLKPAVILQDLVMPVIDGFTLVGMYRANEAISGAAVIALSGNDDPATRAKALAAGASDYLLKLPSKETLVECI